MNSSSGLGLSGLASGLDTDSLIQQLMSVERRPQARLKLQQRQSQVRQDALRDVSTRLKNLESAARDLRSAALWGDTQTAVTTDSSRVAVRLAGPAGPGGHQIEVTRLARSEQRSYSYSPQADDTQLTVGDSALTIPANSSADKVASIINSAGSFPVFAAVITDSASGEPRLVLSGRTPGASNGFTAAAAGLSEDAQRHLPGLDALYEVDGVEHSSPSNVVSDGVLGVELTFKGVTGASPVTVTVSSPKPNLDAIEAKVRTFVDQYNSTVQFINGKLNEKRVPNAQTEADATKGVLQSDGPLRGLLNQLRAAVSSSRLSDVGVSTGAASGGGTLNPDAISGKLTLDDDKLAKALDSDLRGVRSLFGDSLGGGGLSRALEALVHPQTQGGGGLDTRIAGEDSKKQLLSSALADMDRRLQLKQDRLKTQFTAMEKALSGNQSQGQWLSGQIAALSRSRS